VTGSTPVAPALDLGTAPGRIVSIDTDAPCAVIGDIHGRADLLETLLARLPRDATVLVVGDVCDRGPDTRRVIDLLIARCARGALGNHEEWFIRWARGAGFLHEARAIGATATLASYGVTAKAAHDVSARSDAVPREHLAFLETLGHAVDLRVGSTPFWIVHAGVATTQALGRAGSLERVVPYLAQHHPDVLLWAHTDPSATLPVDRPVIMGHICRAAPKDFGHVLAIDTACGTWPDGALTAVLLPERRFITVV